MLNYQKNSQMKNNYKQEISKDFPAFVIGFSLGMAAGIMLTIIAVLEWVS